MKCSLLLLKVSSGILEPYPGDYLGFSDMKNTSDLPDEVSFIVEPNGGLPFRFSHGHSPPFTYGHEIFTIKKEPVIWFSQALSKKEVPIIYMTS